MTYLQLVNGILNRLREDSADTLAGSDDVVVDLVKRLVNDAKLTVEQSHEWNALRAQWDITTADGTATYGTGIDTTTVGNYVIEQVLDSNGVELRPSTLKEIRRKQALGTGNGNPQWYAVNGVDAMGDLQITFYPTPDSVSTISVYGFESQPDLSVDTDVLVVPYQPVLYYALALAARERGEVGGQTAAELFAMADAYLSDAIARDSALNPLDDIWMTV